MCDLIVLQYVCMRWYQSVYTKHAVKQSDTAHMGVVAVPQRCIVYMEINAIRSGIQRSDAAFLLPESAVKNSSYFKNHSYLCY